MKKILEVLQYGEDDIRFNTDIDVIKDPAVVDEIAIKCLSTMIFKLWGGNELSVLAMIRALMAADVAASVDPEHMIESLSTSSSNLRTIMDDIISEMKQSGLLVQTFQPGVPNPKYRNS